MANQDTSLNRRDDALYYSTSTSFFDVKNNGYSNDKVKDIDSKTIELLKQ